MIATLLGAAWLSGAHHHDGHEDAQLGQSCGLCIALESSGVGLVPMLNVLPAYVRINVDVALGDTYQILFQSIGFAHAQSRAPPIC